MCSVQSLRELGWVICLFRVPGLSRGSDPEKPVAEALGGKWLSLKGPRAKQIAQVGEPIQTPAPQQTPPFPGAGDKSEGQDLYHGIKCG